MRTVTASPPTPVSCALHERRASEPWLLLLCAQRWLVAALCVCCTAALRLPAALPPQCMQRPVARQPLSTALRASAAQIRMQSADGAEGEGARRSGVSKGQLVDAISLRAGVSKKTAELVLSAGAACLHSTRRLRTRHRACRARAHLACLHRARLRSTRPVLPHASAEGRAPPCTAALDVIVETVANGDKVTLVNFGTFDSKRREAREGRNPQTNKPMHIPGTCCPGGPVLGCRRRGTATHACAHRSQLRRRRRSSSARCSRR